MTDKILIAYFSGTGGTKRIAEQFNDYFAKNDCLTTVQSLDSKFREQNKIEINKHFAEYKVIVLLYAVHEMDAPLPVYEWIEDLPQGSAKPLALISVSGGGDVWPNKSSRVNCIRELEKKGYDIFWEKMMVMPANVIMYTKEQAALWLLKAVPEKAIKYGSEILSLTRLRNKQRNKFSMFSTRSKTYKKYMKKIGNNFYTNDVCVHCNWCVENCARENIKEVNGEIVFGSDCVICLRCIYGCPKNAIKNKTSTGLLNNGYNLNKLEAKINDIELEPIEKCCKGLLWVGVKKYLLD